MQPLLAKFFHLLFSSCRIISFGSLLVISTSGFSAEIQTNTLPPQKAAKKSVQNGSLPHTITTDSTTVIGDTRAIKEKNKTDSILYEADEIDYRVNEKILHLMGNARVVYQGMILVADTITYQIDSDRFSAIGSPQIIEGTDTTLGEYLTYNIKTKRGMVRYSTSKMDDAYLNGKTIVKDANNLFYCHDGDYTTCAYPSCPHYFFYAQDIKVLPSDMAIARPVVFNIGGVPVATFPFFILPLDRKRTSGWLTPSFGGQPQAGGYLDNIGYYWAINDFFDFRMSAKIAEFKDYMVNASSNYALRYWLSGNISLRYSFAGDFSRSTQLYALDYSHNQTLLPDRSFTLGGRGTLISSKQFYLKNSNRTEDLLNQQITANMSLNKRLEKINSSINASVSRSHNLTTNDKTDEIPALSFSLPTRPLFSPKSPVGSTSVPDTTEPSWFEKVYYSYNANVLVRHVERPNALDKNDTAWIHGGASQNASLSYTTKIFKHISFSPSMAIKMYAVDAYKDTNMATYKFFADTTWDTIAKSTLSAQRLATLFVRDTIPTIDRYGLPDTLYIVPDSIKTDSLRVFKTVTSGAADITWDGGFSMATTLYGIWPLRILNFVGLRHTITPTLNYTFTPKSSAHLNKRFFETGIATFGQLKQTQFVTFSLNNSFDGKTVTKKDSANPVEDKFRMLDVSGSISCDVEKGREGFSDLSLSASTTNKFFAISVSSAFWLYADNSVTEFDIPGLKSYSVNFNPNINMNATGTLWDGDLLVFAGYTGISDPLKYAKSGNQAWQLSLKPSYSFSQSRTSRLDPFITKQNYSLSTSASLAFARNWLVSWSSYYNFETNQLVGHSFDFACDLECWDMRFSWRPSGFNPGYNFLINIKKIPEIKWERKP